MKGLIAMSNKEINQIEVFEKLSRREIKQKTVASMLKLSTRQVKRKLCEYRLHGAASLRHKARGRVSNNKIAQERLDRAITLIRDKYGDFGPTLANEKLLENHGITLSVERLRLEMITVGLWIPKQRRRPHVHPPRAPRACLGELVQLDGSPHDWFEGRGQKCNLNVAIDDATGIAMVMFSQVETTQDYFKLLEAYILKYGIPLALYVDKHSIFRINNPTNLNYKKPNQANDQWEGLTQFNRACQELGIELIFANTAQAKGRVERVNQTLQDRLVREMRLHHVSSIGQANEFVKMYMHSFNQKFSKKPKSGVNMHRQLNERIDLTKILCLKETRVVSRNLTFQSNNQIFSIKTARSAFTLRGTKVIICRRYDGQITVFDDTDKPLDCQVVKTLMDKRAVDSKTINQKLDVILAKQAQSSQHQSSAWDSNQQEWIADNYYYKPNGAV